MTSGRSSGYGQHLFVPASTFSDAGPSAPSPSPSMKSLNATAGPSTVTTPGTTMTGPSGTSPKPKGLKKLRPWSLAVAGRRKSGWGSDKERDKSSASASASDETPPLPITPKKVVDDGAGSVGSPYTDLRIRAYSDQRDGTANPDPEHVQDGVDYGWEGSDEEEARGVEPDTYSWIDPSLLGTDGLRGTPVASRSQLRLPQSGPSSTSHSSASASANASGEHLRLPEPPDPSIISQSSITPDDSYNLLLAYQSTSESEHAATVASPYLSTPSDSDHQLRNPNPEWYEMVNRSLSDSLSKDELKRQGLWWEMIKGEREYVRDMRIVSDVFIQPLRDHQPPLLAPENRLNAFIAEVFSTAQQIYLAHVKLLGLLMERQRQEWPLMMSATDIILGTLLEITDLYDAYMKNYPFAESRVRREQARNPPFRAFLNDRNTIELTKRRDISVFLSRPVTRLPRILLVLEALYKVTPADHPDKDDIPTAIEILQGVVKSTQPGIESAEAKIKLWNVAERLLFKRGEIIELDISDPKRTLVYMGYVFRRVRSETNWHGWQDLHAILLDNYFLLTRDEDHGKHIVVSRPIHLDFLNLQSADGVPERRYDSISRYQRKPNGGMLEPIFQPERLMYPFTIATSGGVNGRTYTLCTATQGSREEWKEKIEGAKTLRKFDIESNRTFAIHTITIPSDIREPIMTADTFTWHNRETVAVATGRSVWLGWRRDARSYRELIRFHSGHITAVSVVPDFGWLLVIASGTLLAFNLKEMIPTSDPSTWVMKGRVQGKRLSAVEHHVAFIRVGVTKDRLLVVYAVHSRNSHQTLLRFEEPLLSPEPSVSTPFRPFGSVTIPGYASELSFFRQTIAVVTEKAFVIAEPGNPTYNSIPTFPNNIAQTATVVRMVSGARPLAMYQVAENEFLLVYDMGACFVTKFGEIARNGAFLRWNLTPSYAVFRPPHLLLFDEGGSHSRAEVRDVRTGRVCEVIEERGMRPFHLCRANQGLVAGSQRCLIQLVETIPIA